MSSGRSRFWFLSSCELAAGVDEQHVGRFAALVEDQDRRRDAGAEEKVRRQADHRFQQVLLDQLLADQPFRAAAEQHAVRHDDADAAVVGQGDFDHVGDEGVVALALGRNASPEPLVRIVPGEVGPPLVERERRIGHHDVELHQRIVFDQLRVGDRVAPLDAGGVLLVQEHVHPAERPRAAVRFLAEERKVSLGLPSTSSTSLATRISSEPEPQAGSQIRSPGLGWTSLARSVETSGGV